MRAEAKGPVVPTDASIVDEERRHAADARDREVKIMDLHDERAEHFAAVQEEKASARHRHDRADATQQREQAALDRQLAQADRASALAALDQPADPDKRDAYRLAVQLAEARDAAADDQDRQHVQADTHAEFLDHEHEQYLTDEHDRRRRLRAHNRRQRQLSADDRSSATAQLRSLEDEHAAASNTAADDLAKAELERDHDALTGLLNRRQIVPLIHRAMDSSRPSDTDVVSVLACDLDDFKSINDTHGHAVGDQVLQVAAARLDNACREGTSCRSGGDEFVVILRTHDTAAAETVAERILESMRAPFATTVGPLALSISIGMARADASSRPSQLLSESDTALYAAKHAGKNQLRSSQRRQTPPTNTTP